MMWGSGTEPCCSRFLELGKSTTLTRNRIMQSLPCKTEALRKHFRQSWQHVATTKDFFYYSTQVRSKANHEHTSDVCKAQLTSPVLPWRFSFSSLLYSLPQTDTWYYQVLPSQFLQKSLTELSHYSSIPSDSFTQERKLAEKKRKRAVTAVWSKEQTLFGLQLWNSVRGVGASSVLSFLLSQYLIFTFKVTVMIALEKVWMLLFLYFSPVCF